MIDNQNPNIIKKANRVSAIFMVVGTAVSILLVYLMYLSDKKAGFSTPIVGGMFVSSIFFAGVYIIMQAIRAFYLKEEYIKYILIHGMSISLIIIILGEIIWFSSCNNDGMCTMFGIVGIFLWTFIAAVLVSAVAGVTHLIKKVSK